jgi:hypothetical protein
VADLLQGRSLDADFCNRDRYFHSHLSRNTASLRPRYHFPNYGTHPPKLSRWDKCLLFSANGDFCELQFSADQMLYLGN